MALVDLTNVNPYEGQVEAQRRLDETNAKVWGNLTNQISQSIQAGITRRQALNARNQELRDREYALANEATGKLVQANTSNKYTDMQLQQVGRQFKQEYYDAVKTYQDSDKSDEARQTFEEAKQASLGAARTINGSLESLGTSMEAFKQQIKNGGISDSMDPAVRSFFADLNSPDVDPSQYQIIKDPETGALKYSGETSDGYPVDFFLEDIANGENQFSPIPKTNMPEVVQNLTQGLSNIVKQEERDWGVVQATDWSTAGSVLSSRIDDLVKETDNFRGLAAGLGYGYEELEMAANGEPFTDQDGREITNEDDLKKAIKLELMQQVEAFTPHQEQTLSVKEQKEVEAKNDITSAISAVTSEDPAAFDQYLNKAVILQGAKANIHSFVRNGNKITIIGRSGKNKISQEFDLSDPNSSVLFQSIITGQDYNLIKKQNDRVSQLSNF